MCRRCPNAENDHAIMWSRANRGAAVRFGWKRRLLPAFFFLFFDIQHGAIRHAGPGSNRVSAEALKLVLKSQAVLQLARLFERFLQYLTVKRIQRIGIDAVRTRRNSLQGMLMAQP
jgi:hypothetical protein